MSDARAALATEPSLTSSSVPAMAPEAFARACTQLRVRLVAALRRVTRDPHLAEDLFQQAVLRAWRHLGAFDGRRFDAWLHRIAMNLAFSATRRRALGDRPADPQNHEGLGAETSRQATPLETLLNREDANRVRSALEQLSPRQARILEMRYLEGLRCFEIAERLQTTPNTISIVLCRARQRLREALSLESA